MESALEGMSLGEGGGRGTHYNGLYGEVPSLRVIIFRLQVCELKYVEGSWNLSFTVWFKGLKGLKDVFHVLRKVERTFSVLWFIHILKTVHLEQLEGIQSCKLRMWKRYHSTTHPTSKGTSEGNPHWMKLIRAQIERSHYQTETHNKHKFVDL